MAAHTDSDFAGCLPIIDDAAQGGGGGGGGVMNVPRKAPLEITERLPRKILLELHPDWQPRPDHGQLESDCLRAAGFPCGLYTHVGQAPPPSRVITYSTRGCPGVSEELAEKNKYVHTYKLHWTCSTITLRFVIVPGEYTIVGHVAIYGENKFLQPPSNVAQIWKSRIIRMGYGDDKLNEGAGPMQIIMRDAFRCAQNLHIELRNEDLLVPTPAQMAAANKTPVRAAYYAVDASLPDAQTSEQAPAAAKARKNALQRAKATTTTAINRENEWWRGVHSVEVRFTNSCKHSNTKVFKAQGRGVFLWQHPSGNPAQDVVMAYKPFSVNQLAWFPRGEWDRRLKNGRCIRTNAGMMTLPVGAVQRATPINRGGAPASPLEETFVFMPRSPGSVIGISMKPTYYWKVVSAQSEQSKRSHLMRQPPHPQSQAPPSTITTVMLQEAAYQERTELIGRLDPFHPGVAALSYTARDRMAAFMWCLFTGQGSSTWKIRKGRLPLPKIPLEIALMIFHAVSSSSWISDEHDQTTQLRLEIMDLRDAAAAAATAP